MCTVTFLPLDDNNFILTSNRDEQKERETFSPRKYEDDGVQLVYPKDKTAGGTWIGVSSKKRLVCILNGAFEKHVRKERYAKSRGVIAKEVLKEEKLEEYIKKTSLNNVEPFTLVIVDWNNNSLSLFELIWDETSKHFTKLENKPAIWSSSTLYSNEMKQMRRNWFNKWVCKNEFTSEAILKFHHSEIGDKEQSIFMKRPYVETVSITSVKKEGVKIKMQYDDKVRAEKEQLIF